MATRPPAGPSGAVGPTGGPDAVQEPRRPGRRAVGRPGVAPVGSRTAATVPVGPARHDRPGAPPDARRPLAPTPSDRGASTDPTLVPPHSVPPSLMTGGARGTGTRETKRTPESVTNGRDGVRRVSCFRTLGSCGGFKRIVEGTVLRPATVTPRTVYSPGDRD